jgi:hypothetical protein
LGDELGREFVIEVRELHVFSAQNYKAMGRVAQRLNRSIGSQANHLQGVMETMVRGVNGMKVLDNNTLIFYDLRAVK